jgi:O-antigen ligase/polysaccharide polymerase Wzy-like membrane protein
MSTEVATRPVGVHGRPMPRGATWTVTAGGLLVGFGALVVLTTLAFTNGGYFPTAWGWSALVLFSTGALGLLLQQWPGFSRLESATLASLAGFVGWVALSTVWTTTPAQTPLEVERDIVYVGGLLTLLVFLRRHSISHLVGGLACATTCAAGYGLLTRLFPARFGTFDSIAGYRLDQPLGYWNALGIFVAMGALLSLGLAARAASLLARVAAGAATVVLVLTLYFTFSRGSWLALGFGLVCAIAFDPRRLHLTTTALVLAPWSAFAVAAAASSGALTRTGAPLAQASHEGHRLAWIVLVLVAAAGATTLVLSLAERRIDPGTHVRTVFATALALAAIAAILGAVARYGSPPTILSRGYHSFSAPPVRTGAAGSNLNARLFNLSSDGRTAVWHAAWHDYESHWLLGSGAGSYERYWLRHRPTPMKVRDAHSLYLEVLAELGPVGLGLLVLALGIPLAAGVRARGQALVPAVLGAYVAYLLHAGVDWDWEMVVVTLSALACASALLKASASTRPRELRLRARVVLASGAIALSAFALVGLLGNTAVANANRASVAKSWKDEATNALRAMRFAPWLTDPWRLRAESRYSLGDRTGAHADLLRALRKDPHDWNLWWDLAVVERGTARRTAFGRALSLDPLSPELAQSRSWLGISARLHPGL